VTPSIAQQSFARFLINPCPADPAHCCPTLQSLSALQKRILMKLEHLRNNVIRSEDFCPAGEALARTQAPSRNEARSINVRTNFTLRSLENQSVLNLKKPNG